MQLLWSQLLLPLPWLPPSLPSPPLWPLLLFAGAAAFVLLPLPSVLSHAVIAIAAATAIAAIAVLPSLLLLPSLPFLPSLPSPLLPPLMLLLLLMMMMLLPPLLMLALLLLMHSRQLLPLLPLPITVALVAHYCYHHKGSLSPAQIYKRSGSA